MYIPIDIDWARGLIGVPIGITLLMLVVQVFNGSRFVEVCRTAIFGPFIIFCVCLLISIIVGLFYAVRDSVLLNILLIISLLSLIPGVCVSPERRRKKIPIDYHKYTPNIYVDDKSNYLYGYKFARKYKDAKEIIEYRGLYKLLEELRAERFEMTREETEDVINKIYSFPMEDKNHIGMILEIEALLNKNLRYNESSKFKRFVDELFGRI